MAKDFKILFFDTEMSGIGQLVSIGYVITDADGNELSHDYFLIKPRKPISAISTSIHGITTEVAKAEGITLKKAIGRFDNAAKDCSLIVGFAIGNDLCGLSIAYRQVNRVPTFIKKSTTVVDVAQMAEEYLYNEGLGKRGQFPGLDHLYTTLFDGETFHNHIALDDARATARCYRRIYEDAPFNFRSIVLYSHLLKIFKHPIDFDKPVSKK